MKVWRKLFYNIDYGGCGGPREASFFSCTHAVATTVTVAFLDETQLQGAMETRMRACAVYKNVRDIFWQHSDG